MVEDPTDEAEDLGEVEAGKDVPVEQPTSAGHQQEGVGSAEFEE